MPSISANIEHLADLDLYKTEKPYGALLSNGAEFFKKGHRLDNIEFTEHRHNLIDVKDDKSKTLPVNGFQLYEQKSETMWDVLTVEGARRHREEIAEWLKEKLDAVFVHTYDLRTRLNDEKQRDKVDVLDTLVVEPRARGAHNDVTLKSGPEIFFNHLIDGQMEYLKPGYRVRVMNTWRPLLLVIEDCPLAFCDASSIDPKDLIAADRVYPHSVGEVYYLKYNPNQQWCWIEGQTPEDVLVMTMYDSHPGNDARFCPHVSFVNERARPDAPPRQSMETRSIVISKIKDTDAE